jgi:hypothetical protein
MSVHPDPSPCTLCDLNTHACICNMGTANRLNFIWLLLGWNEMKVEIKGITQCVHEQKHSVSVLGFLSLA